MRKYVKYILPNKIYRVDNRILDLRDKKGKKIPGCHEVVIVKHNKRSKTCFIKLITSLEQNGKFKNDKLNDVKQGKIIVISKKELNSKHLSGINNNIYKVKMNKLFVTESETKYPKRYKNIIKKG